MRFLQPLEDFAANALDTHYLGFEVYYRRSRFSGEIPSLSLGRFSREISVDVTLFETNEENRSRECQASLLFDEIPQAR